MALIRIINPNSNDGVTQAMSEALEPLRLNDGPTIDCVTIAEGPFGVESDDDVRVAGTLVRNEVKKDTKAAAFVIACYSDPGLAEARQETSKPVFGMAESAILTAGRTVFFWG